MKKEECILLAHGSGGMLTRRLLEELVFPALRNPWLEKTEDSAVVGLSGKTAFTTDSFVIDPVFFPGGDIGKLAVCGTVNDLAVMAARPLYLTAACVIEEGFPMESFRKIILSMKRACRKAGITIVGGDLKVVEKGACDGIFITTSGIGTVIPGTKVGAANARPGDAVVINGSIGDHGAAVMACRREYGLDTHLLSDCAPLNGLVEEMIKSGATIRVMRDPTRGGVATTVDEICRSSGVTVELDEDALPVRPSVRGLSELLGLEPLYLANEGKLLAFCAERDAPRLLAAMRRHPLGRQSRVIGRVTGKGAPAVLLRTTAGSTRILTPLAGEQLPRIC